MTRDEDAEKAGPLLGWTVHRYQSPKGTRGIYFAKPDSGTVDYPAAGARLPVQLAFVGEVAEAMFPSDLDAQSDFIYDVWAFETCFDYSLSAMVQVIAAKGSS